MTLRHCIAFGRARIEQGELLCSQQLQRIDDPGHVCNQLLARCNEQGLVCGTFRCPKCDQDAVVCLTELTGRMRFAGEPSRS